MNCQKIRKRITGGFLDGELTPQAAGEVESHLSHCASCREFHEELMRLAVAPFKKAGQSRPPESVWTRIEASLDHEESRSSAFNKSPLENFREGLRDILEQFWNVLPKPLLGLTTLAAAVLVVIVITQPFKGKAPAGPYPADPLLYLAGFNSLDNGYADEEENFGTAVEFFLL